MRQPWDFPNMWDLCEGTMGLVVGSVVSLMLAFSTDWWLALLSLSAGGSYGFVSTRRKIAVVIKGRQDPAQNLDESINIFGCFFLLASVVLIGLIWLFEYVFHHATLVLGFTIGLTSYVAVSGGTILVLGFIPGWRGD